MGFIDLDIKLKAKNSSGDQVLWLSKQDGWYNFTLCGDYNGERIQIDFDEMDKSKLEELKLQIELILNHDS